MKVPRQPFSHPAINGEASTPNEIREKFYHYLIHKAESKCERESSSWVKGMFHIERPLIIL